jgi:dTDP-4-amino-4,6-dideoxygalactose transaminase
MDKKIFVTQPSLPPLEEFLPSLREIWDSKILTNGGKFHQELEKALGDYLGVEHISLFNNGTIALMVALQSLDLKGEVITTPYSFIATANSIVWNNLKPVFVDIDPITLNLDPKAVEKAITDKTSAILPVHCYGIPCDVSEFQKLAEEYNLRVIYDAAHAFGINLNGRSLLRHGDISVLSFHATKVFNTFEGGAIVCNSASLKSRIDQLKNFGYVSESVIDEAGLNGKMSEINASFGLVQLKHVQSNIDKRKAIHDFYSTSLKSVKGIRCVSLSDHSNANYSYFPILIEDEYGISRDDLHALLFEHGIVARKYFYPLITEFGAYRDIPSSNPQNLSVATRVSRRVLCLPIYPDLCYELQKRVVTTILEAESAG